MVVSAEPLKAHYSSELWLDNVIYSSVLDTPVQTWTSRGLLWCKIKQGMKSHQRILALLKNHIHAQWHRKSTSCPITEVKQPWLVGFSTKMDDCPVEGWNPWKPSMPKFQNRSTSCSRNGSSLIADEGCDGFQSLSLELGGFPSIW